MKTKIVTDISLVITKLGIPTHKWPGKCMWITTEIHKARLVPRTTKICYGMFLGEIHKASVFAGRPFTHHAWLELPDFTIYDPTRWTLTMEKPYVWEGHARHPDYDLGSCSLEKDQPVPAITGEPAFKMTVLQFQLVEKFFHEIAREGPDRMQWHWLAHRHPDEIGKDVGLIYKLMIKRGLGVMIPIDLRRYVLGPDYQKPNPPAPNR